MSLGPARLSKGLIQSPELEPIVSLGPARLPKGLIQSPELELPLPARMTALGPYPKMQMLPRERAPTSPMARAPYPKTATLSLPWESAFRCQALHFPGAHPDGDIVNGSRRSISPLPQRRSNGRLFSLRRSAGGSLSSAKPGNARLSKRLPESGVLLKLGDASTTLWLK